MVPAAHDQADTGPDPETHARPRVRSFELDPERFGNLERNRARERPRIGPCPSRQDRALGQERDQFRIRELRAKRHLVLDRVHPRAERLGIERFEERLQFTRQTVREQVGRLASEDPPPGRGQACREPDLHPAVGIDADAGAFEHLLAHRRDLEQAALA